MKRIFIISVFFSLFCDGKGPGPRLGLRHGKTKEDRIRMLQNNTRSVCPATGPVAGFCNVNVNNNLCVSGAINGSSGNVFFGNTVRVDQVYGNDILGQRNGFPFLTINAALAAAQAGDEVWVFPGTYNEALVIKNGVTIHGLSSKTVTIQQLNVTGATDLVTMGENTRLENVTLQLTSGLHVPLRGVVFPGTTSDTAEWLNSILIIDNSGAGPGSSNVYGVHSIGSAFPAFEFATIDSCSISVSSTGAGAKRGILVDTANGFNVDNISIDVDMPGGTNAIGVEVNNAGAKFIGTSSTIGGDTADISQTAGTLSIGGAVILTDSTANNLGFEDLTFPQLLIWGDPDTPLNAPFPGLFMRPVTGDASATPIFILAPQKFVAFEIAVRVIVPPGIGNSTTFTLQRNGVDTPVSATLVDNQTTADIATISQHFDDGDNISMKVVTSAGALTADALVTVSVY